MKTTRNTWYFGIAPRARTFSQKSGKFAEITEIHKVRGISQNFNNFTISAEIPEKCGSGPPPRPQPNLDRRRFPDLGSAPLPGARALGPGATGIRPRADGNPAPSRRKSGPEPTEIRPRADGNPTPSRRKSCPDPDPLPPFKNTYLTHFPFGSDAARPPLTPIFTGYTTFSKHPTGNISTGITGTFLW